MAKLSAHGNEVGRIVYRTTTKAYFEDGHILENYGHGWKLRAKLKPGVIPSEAFKRAQLRLEEFYSCRPNGLRYTKALHAITGQCNRLKLHTAISLMPEDADGVWSHVCDGYADNVHADVDEISELCRLYLAAQRESKEINAVTNSTVEA
jgi:hypothetical protein